MDVARSTSEFLLDPALDAAIGQAADTLTRSSYCVALTGAGISVESGIPPFRGPGGLWTKYGEPPMDGYQRFLKDPAAAWRERLHPTAPWAQALRDTLGAAKPNPAHLSLAELERRGVCGSVITQNVDDLHTQAGTRNVLEIHGNNRLLRCMECMRRFEPEDVNVDPDALPPHCPECGGVVKGDIVHFGEPIPPDVLRRCYEEVERADCMLVVGTSGTVYPAAEFPLIVLRQGGAMIEVNGEDTDITRAATQSLRGPAGVVLERLLQRVVEMSGAQAT